MLRGLTCFSNSHTQITARALLSEKSNPSLTFPLHTARNKAPVVPFIWPCKQKQRHQYIILMQKSFLIGYQTVTGVHSVVKIGHGSFKIWSTWLWLYHNMFFGHQALESTSKSPPGQTTTRVRPTTSRAQSALPVNHLIQHSVGRKETKDTVRHSITDILNNNPNFILICKCLNILVRSI